jgi:hypothetical protein
MVIVRKVAQKSKETFSKKDAALVMPGPLLSAVMQPTINK